MTGFLRAALVVGLGLGAGCARVPTGDVGRGEPVAAVAPAAEPVFEVSAAARAKLLAISREMSLKPGWRVRMEFTPEGCTGMKTKLDIDTGPFGPADATCESGGVGCVYLRDQFPLAQGSLIDWIEAEQGFKVTHPNKTAENRAKTSKWITDEFEKWKQGVAQQPAGG